MEEGRGERLSNDSLLEYVIRKNESTSDQIVCGSNLQRQTRESERSLKNGRGWMVGDRLNQQMIFINH